MTPRLLSLEDVPAETQPNGCGRSGSTDHGPILVPSDGTRNLSNMCSPDHIPMEAPEKSASLLELEREICELAAHIAVATCRWLLLLAEFDSRDGWAECGLKSCAHWLSWKCSIALGVAREKVRVAHRLEELPLVREAFSRGELSYCKVRALTRAATPETEEGLLEIARHATGAQLEKLIRCYSSALSASLGSAQRQQELRHLRWSWNEDGSLRVEGRLPADDGALLINALSGVEEQCAEGDDYVASLAGARRADALVTLARGAARAGAVPELVVHVDAATLTTDEVVERSEVADGPTIPAETARRLGCDAAVVRIVEQDGRLVHEGGFRVERSGRGAVRFRRPDGRAIAPAPGCGSALGGSLAEQHRARGVIVDASTCRPLSAGDRLDYGLAVEVLLPRALAAAG